MTGLPWWSAYVGRSFGTGPDDVNCWSLIRAVFRDVRGIELPEFGDVSPRDLYRVARKMDQETIPTIWRAVEPGDVREFDVVRMRSGRGGLPVVHVGIMTGPSLMLHAEEATGVVTIPIADGRIRPRVVDFRRYRP